ncbi:MAG TPA: response regulator [Myxococcaceae bacterium]|nr:response regulator [Myxococcaceae bacterium]
MSGRYDERRKALPAQVLVVDDDPANVRLVEIYLQSEGMRTVGVESGADALARVAEGGIDLVLLDIRMPHMDGFEVCRRLRGDPRNAGMPVVFLTAEANDSESELQGLEAGADEYLHKPIQRRELTLRVKNLLRLATAERERRLVAQLSQAEKLAAIGQIAAGVAHEINNPLGFMISNLATLESYSRNVVEVIDAYRKSPAEGRAKEEETGFAETLADLDDLIRETADGGERVRHIVQALKTFSRADDGTLEPVDLAEIAASTLILTEREISQRAKLIKQLKPAFVSHAPKGKLHQVTLNLLVNALQALDGVSNHPHQISIETGTCGEDAFLIVSDTGCGISEENRGRLFEPFFTTKPIGVGTGIGLSVCANVVRKLGGRIDVASELGRGSTFTIRVPQQAGQSVRPAESALQ